MIFETHKNKWVDMAWNLAILVFGTFLIALAIQLFYVPHNIVAGGVSGLAIVFNILFQWNIATFTLIVNAVLLVIGSFMLGKEFLAKTLLGSVLLPFFMGIIPAYNVVPDDTLTAVIFGALITGVGIILVFFANGSTGGTTVPPMIFNKYFGMKFATGVMLCDAAVMTSAIFLVAIGKLEFEMLLYATVSIVIIKVVTDYFETGLTRSSAVYIISNKADDIRDMIFEKIGRGATYIEAKGAYAKDPRPMLLCVINRRQVKAMKELVDQIDPNSFVIISSVSEVHGEGFLNRHKKEERELDDDQRLEML
ncbi:YitT family protein [Culicoidibacter larvae]|uniref:YitT family protein n=1 Tax=Culicoidibacter larvae TaxID=2579976 RepID=A0A5R8Q9V1_9FIRM|nr:YitT family protein [Culicoidibacter larvae]TLG72704.1 YitT family protein [Culicoidibacter larvae]